MTATDISRPDRTDPLRGRVVAITGASSGIGEATALLLAARGAHVVVGARRRERLDDVVARITAGGGTAVATVVDVRRRDDLVALVDLARQRFGRLDVIVNNAGVSPIGPMSDVAVDAWEAMIDVNLRGTLYGIAAALPHFLEQGSGHVVNVVSTSGLKIVPGQAVYAGTKNAVRTISEALRQESEGGYRVTVVSPGMTRTSLASSMDDPAVRVQTQRAMDELGIDPSAIARAIAFAIEQPDGVDVGDVVVRPTAQG
ncbi:SDR family oxidoreductase [Nocardioides sp.]|uniref:SDR family oxidoreductase n=1 Tax=Nocardioides sp. TaxID=35761 RepID=UPI002718918D|nr:SDR family oxidoreductase [Nocardioides sp.]MDO9454849.1 SDR family oxidoreductase [Nocardioides sp.]